MNIEQKITDLDLPKGEFIVVGSGVLSALGIRQPGDIDLIVGREVYDQLERQDGWSYGKWGEQTVLQKDFFDIGTDWYGKSVYDLLERAEYIGTIPYMSLDDVYEWKKGRGQEKDLADLELIEAYQHPYQ